MKQLQTIPTQVNAEFTDEQIQALRIHVLPELERIAPSNSLKKQPVSTFVNVGTAPRGPSNRGKRTKEAESWNWATCDLQEVCALLHSIVDKKSPAMRAMNLKEALNELQSNDGRSTRDINKILPLALRRIKAIPATKLTPAGIQAQRILGGQYFKLLQQSWPYIVSESVKEHRTLLKKHGLVVLKKASKQDVAEVMKKLLPDWTFTEEKVEVYEGHQVTNYIAIDPDGLRKLEPRETIYGFSIRPSYRMDRNSSVWFSWERFGVDDGAARFDYHVSVQAAVEMCLDTINTAMERRLAVETNGVDYDFGGTKHKMLPEQFQKVVQALKDRGYWETGPGGFGTYTVYTTRRDDNAASPMLSKAVGMPVYWHKEDRD